MASLILHTSTIGTIHVSYLVACGQVLKYVYRFFMCEEMFLCLEINSFSLQIWSLPKPGYFQPVSLSIPIIVV